MTTQFFKVDKNIFQLVKDHDLTSSEFELLIAITSLSDNEQGVCFASNKTLGNLINKSEKYISRLISKLVLKKVINLKLVQKGTKIKINNKEYTTYRLITLAGVTQMDNTSSVQMNKTPLTQMDNQSKLKETKTKIIKTNLSTSNVENKVKPSKSDKRDITHSEMYQYAMELIKDKKNIGNKSSYALVMVINWRKNGIKSVSELKNINSQPKSNNVIVEKVPDYINPNGTKVTKKADPKIIAEIEELKARLLQN